MKPLSPKKNDAISITHHHFCKFSCNYFENGINTDFTLIWDNSDSDSFYIKVDDEYINANQSSNLIQRVDSESALKWTIDNGAIKQGEKYLYFNASSPRVSAYTQRDDNGYLIAYFYTPAEYAANEGHCNWSDFAQQCLTKIRYDSVAEPAPEPDPEQPQPEGEVYKLDGTITGGSNDYSKDSAIIQANIDWAVRGNTTMNPWRIGGRNLTSVDRALYSKTALEGNITKIEIKHGAADSITVNSMTVIVANDPSFSNVISELTPTFITNSTITVLRPSGADWTDCYYKFVYNVTVSSDSNKFIQFKSAAFII